MYEVEEKFKARCDQMRQDAKKVFNKGFRAGFEAGVRQGRKEVEAEILMRT